MMARRGQDGFSLIEVALAVAMIGIVMAIIFSFYGTVQAQKRMRITHERMNLVAEALSTYVETAGRLPCPSDPASPDAPAGADPVLGWERGVAYSQTTVASAAPVGACDQNTAEGIVPFITLGLPYEAALDGWGGYFTYAVSPVFTQQTDQSGGAAVDTGNVHALCRTGRWVTNSDNANAPKARYCCAQDNGVFGPATDIVMNDTAGNRLVDARLLTPADYAAVDQRFAAEAPLAMRDDIDAPAFVLVSHGRNRFGAYLVNNTAGRVPFTTPAGQNAFERINADAANRNYHSGPVIETPGAGHFDDIVLWRTQDGLMAYNGTSSCFYP